MYSRVGLSRQTEGKIRWIIFWGVGVSRLSNYLNTDERGPYAGFLKQWLSTGCNCRPNLSRQNASISIVCCYMKTTSSNVIVHLENTPPPGGEDRIVGGGG